MSVIDDPYSQVRQSQGNVVSLTERTKALQESNAKALQEARAKAAEAAKLSQELKNAKTLSQNANVRLNAANTRTAELERAAAAEKEASAKAAAVAKAQLDAANAAVAKVTGEQAALKADSEKSQKTIIQLKQLGRKFKEQNVAITNEKEELRKENEELKVK